MKEIYKDIPNYEGLYQISNFGNVKSLRSKRIMKTSLWQSYPVVQLSNHYVRHTFEIHRLVAEAFIPNPNHYPFINHRNENRCDYSINNLEWCTQKMNVLHSRRKMYHPANFNDINSAKYIYTKKCKSKIKNKEYIYYFYRVSIPRIKVDKIFSKYENAVKFRNKCISLIDGFYKSKQKEYELNY